ncbi:hypothetical protein SLH46_04615 [Draconibacterium sp. IB214405]|uniref:hypothetical protein n=1 Tax=Draconibacterium sp. IB214405 TaxID=3097352 RepID=UPI002A0FF152|nr:hypothetical protein [Draconibacterium sp. IB214405]MDX8338451.1 hypothetical protein [Draconibacterium sp. IB214405]
MKTILTSLVCLAIFSSCNNDCECTEPELISFVVTSTYKHQESNVLDYFIEYDICCGSCDLYWHNINPHTIEYCSNSNFIPTDSMQLVVGTSDLTAVNHLPYTKKPWEGYPVLSINGISGDGVVYYQAGFEYGRLPIGDDTSFEIIEIDTIPWGPDSMNMLGFYLMFDEAQEYWLYENWRTGLWEPVPDTNFVTTTFRYYISNIGLFELDDFIDIGGECYCP